MYALHKLSAHKQLVQCSSQKSCSSGNPAHRQAAGRAEGQEGRQPGGQTARRPGGQTDRRADSQAAGRADGQEGRQPGGQTAKEDCRKAGWHSAICQKDRQEREQASLREEGVGCNWAAKKRASKICKSEYSLRLEEDLYSLGQCRSRIY